MHYAEHMYLYLIPSLVISIYLTWAGFTAPPQRGLLELPMCWKHPPHPYPLPRRGERVARLSEAKPA